MNPLKQLREQGQSVWLDYLARRFIADGGLKKLIDEDGLAGVTSNPSIFNKAIGGSADYDNSLRARAVEGDRSVTQLYESVAIEDIRHAADVLRPVYDAAGGQDGFVSLECSPYIADDTDATIAEARRLWKDVGRPNLMVKVPGTEAGLPAIRQLLGEGININITLLFARSVYRDVAEAYLAGLEKFVASGGDAKRLASVASFFVSRIDSAVDKRIEDRLKTLSGADAMALGNLRGTIAIANAKLAYQDYKRLFSGPRWQKLAAKGARVQRLLWASTSTKNPAYRDVLYVEELIGRDTINTLPQETLDAFRDHGKVRPSIEENVASAERELNALHGFGISLDEITTQLTRDGVRLFADAFDELLGTVAKRRAGFLGTALDSQSANLPAEAENAVKAATESWRKSGNVRRLWRGDATLWSNADEAKWLGWLGIAGEESGQTKRLSALAADAAQAQFSHVVLIGMGGSSLGAEVFARTFGKKTGAPELLVIDSTDPGQIATIESHIDLARTLFVVASKSGSTLEPNILKDYFFDRVQAAVGKDKAGAQFIAITDPGSKLGAAAAEEKFRHICLGKPEIGGRYSVLSDFGLVPAALMGVDVEKLLAATETLVRSCGSDVPPAENPGVQLGLMLGTLAKAGRDKLTIIASPAIADFGAWMEQLVAESTGKNGKGIIPVDAEPLGPLEFYGKDRVFAYLRLEGAIDAGQEGAIAKLESSGQPVIRITLSDRSHIGQEFFRWEIATAVAGAVLGINPFDQPDVEASKVETRKLMDAYERDGSLPAENPLFEENGIAVFADANNARVLRQAGDGAHLVGTLKTHFARAHEGDYCAILAYIERNERHERALRDMRTAIRDKKRVATCVGFGPRFLHSTGQAYKGGPNTGVFLQITADPARDIPVPGKRYSFGAVIAAQARGDLAILNERGRRAIRVHLKNADSGLTALSDAVRRALG